MKRKLTFLDWYSVFWVIIIAIETIASAVINVESNPFFALGQLLSLCFSLPVVAFVITHTFGEKE